MVKAQMAGTLTAAGQAGPALGLHGKANMTLWGSFTGTVVLQRSFDGGAVWHTCTRLGSAVTFAAPCSEVFEEPEENVVYRLICLDLSSGAITWRLSQ